MSHIPSDDEGLREELASIINDNFEAYPAAYFNYEVAINELMALISQKIVEAKREAYGHGLLTGGMPEAIGKPMAIDYLATLTTKQDTKEKG
jgi:hypothetical protein